jgi:uncharacterized membrane protein
MAVGRPCGWAGAVALAAFAGLASSNPAYAEFTVCNQTLDVVNLAVGQEMVEGTDAHWQTEGWWTVGANQCVDVIRDEIVNRFIYIYAMDVFGQPILNGTTPMCVGGRRFVIRGDEDCWVRGYQQAPFFEVDTLKTVRWTLFLGARGIE